MRVRVLAFATARDTLGTEALEVDLPEGATVSALREELVRDFPGLEGIWPRLAVAVDGEMASPERVLTDTSEVALLPPVSGGAPKGWITEDPLDPGTVADRVRGPGRGAVVLFLGAVRDSSLGRRVRGILYSSYREMAGARLDRIVTEIEAETAGLTAAVAHRVGVLEVGETSVVIATASPHREEAYRANRRILERLKREVPIWKRERYADGSEVWREEESLAGE
ncbi:MAG: molybdenum cofactor biosynthesis protein MoaE [Thermoanaerobaculia bacterium]|nr:molybdenum cofactor biosynthesis protein MoaE [Thermoanaerobaculia bacterium]